MSYIDKGAIKVIEIIGVSEKSWEEAVDMAVSKTAETVKGITGVEVTAPARSLSPSLSRRRIQFGRAPLGWGSVVG